MQRPSTALPSYLLPAQRPVAGSGRRSPGSQLQTMNLRPGTTALLNARTLPTVTPGEIPSIQPNIASTQNLPIFAPVGAPSIAPLPTMDLRPDTRSLLNARTLPTMMPGVLPGEQAPVAPIQTVDLRPGTTASLNAQTLPIFDPVGTPSIQPPVG